MIEWEGCKAVVTASVNLELSGCFAHSVCMLAPMVYVVHLLAGLVGHVSAAGTSGTQAGVWNLECAVILRLDS